MGPAPLLGAVRLMPMRYSELAGRVVALRGEAIGRGSHIQLAKEVMPLPGHMPEPVNPLTRGPGLPDLPAGAIPRPAAMNRRINEQLPRP